MVFRSGGKDSSFDVHPAKAGGVAWGAARVESLSHRGGAVGDRFGATRAPMGAKIGLIGHSEAFGQRRAGSAIGRGVYAELLVGPVVSTTEALLRRESRVMGVASGVLDGCEDTSWRKHRDPDGVFDQLQISIVVGAHQEIAMLNEPKPVGEARFVGESSWRSCGVDNESGSRSSGPERGVYARDLPVERSALVRFQSGRRDDVRQRSLRNGVCARPAFPCALAKGWSSWSGSLPRSVSLEVFRPADVRLTDEHDSRLSIQQ